MGDAKRESSLLGVDLLRHVLAIAVILQHMHSAARYSAETNLRIQHLVFYAQGAVLGFFFLSGFFFGAPRQTAKGVNLAWSFVVQRTKRLLVPFFLFSIFNACVLIALKQLTPALALRGMFSLHGVGPQLYFLSELFLINCFAFLLLQSAKDKRIRLGIFLLVAIAACLVSWRFPTPVATGSAYVLIPAYLFAFLLGSSLATLRSTFSRAWWPALAGIVVVLCLMGAVDYREWYLAAVLTAFAIAVAASPFLPKRRLPGSGAVYLLHTPILNFAVSTGLNKEGITQWPNVVLSIVLTYGICIGICFLVVRFAPRMRWLILE